MRVAFRVDASRKIGYGHFMRCLTLADALKPGGAQVRFVCRHLPDGLRALLSPRGHALAVLNGAAEAPEPEALPHAHFLGTSQQRDATDTLQALSGAVWDWLVVDHYAIDARWESVLRQAARNVMVIDDIADRTHDCDVLLDQNLYPDMETRYAGKVSDRCRSLLGPRYALLRDDFRQLRERTEPRSGLVRRIFVFLGGADPENLTERAIRALRRSGDGFAVDVVVGGENPHRAAIEDTCRSFGYECHVQTTRMAELMAAADLAIGAGGSASWERCCLGLATLSVAFADNQVRIAAALDSAGACLFLGDQFTATEQRMAEGVRTLVEDRRRLSEISRNAFALVDGRGAERVRDTLCAP